MNGSSLLSCRSQVFIPYLAPWDCLQSASAPSAFHNSGEDLDTLDSYPNSGVVVMDELRYFASHCSNSATQGYSGSTAHRIPKGRLSRGVSVKSAPLMVSYSLVSFLVDLTNFATITDGLWPRLRIRYARISPNNIDTSSWTLLRTTR